MYVYKYIIYTSYVTCSSEGLSICSKMNMFHYPVIIPFEGDKLVPWHHLSHVIGGWTGLVMNSSSIQNPSTSTQANQQLGGWNQLCLSWFTNTVDYFDISTYPWRIRLVLAYMLTSRGYFLMGSMARTINIAAPWIRHGIYLAETIGSIGLELQKHDQKLWSLRLLGPCKVGVVPGASEGLDGDWMGIGWGLEDWKIRIEPFKPRNIIKLFEI